MTSSDDANSRWIVITTINPPGRTIELISQRCLSEGWRAVVVGDTKTPADWSFAGFDFLSVADQRSRYGDFAERIPYRHYCRKNLGYLYAIEQGADVILETDDDNHPYETFGKNIELWVKGRLLSGPGWLNVYQHFADNNSERPLWPRGLPLDAIDSTGIVTTLTDTRRTPIQQFLADNDPDVDAVYRLTTKSPFFFQKDAETIVVDRDAWIPFNSQNTVFFREAFPLLYLPCHVSFRMTDIWRSFVAQAALRKQGWSFAFHPPTVEQVRNEHDLMRDFADEIPGYLHNRTIGDQLDSALNNLPHGLDVATTAARLWQTLIGNNFVPESEKPILEEWFRRIDVLM